MSKFIEVYSNSIFNVDHIASVFYNTDTKILIITLVSGNSHVWEKGASTETLAEAYERVKKELVS